MDNEKALERVINLQEVFDVLMQHLRTWVLFIASGFVVGIFLIAFKTPVYESTALLQVSTNSSGGDNLLSKIAGLNGAGGFAMNSEMQTEQYILKSRAVLENAIKTAHLDIMANPLYFPFIGRAYANHHTVYDDLSIVHPPILGLARYNWGGGKISVTQFEVPKPLLHKTFLIQYLGGNQYLLSLAGKPLLKGYIGYPMIGQVNGLSFTLTVTSILANQDARFTLIKQSSIAALGMLKGQINIALPQMSANLLRISAKGPITQDLQSKLTAVVNSGIDLGVQMRVEKAKKVLTFLEQQAPQIKNRINQLSQSMDNTMPMGSQFVALSQEKSIQNLMYTNVLMDAEQYELQKASSIGKIAVVTPPTPIQPLLKIGSSMMLMLSLFLGTIVGAIFIFCRHYIFGVVYSAEQVARVTGLPLLASLQQSRAQVEQRTLFEKGRVAHLQLLSEKDEGDLTLEGFRSFKTNLQLNYFYGRSECSIITIGGPVPSIGKSFVSANLAEQLALTGKKVLLIDADIRKGSLWEYFFDFRPHNGLVDFLKGKDQDGVIQHTRIPNLNFISSGELHSKHLELLIKDKFQEILQRLKQVYDFIIIDTAPVFAVSDALLVCRHADFNFMVFAYGKHNEKDIDVCVRKFEDANVKLHGFVMNMMLAPGLGYYKYGYYKYGYRAYGK